MSKISELGSITGANTRPEDLFVIVNLVQGDDGTKNITRKELVQAIQYEIFDRITITGGTISGVIMSDSRLDNVRIDNSDMEDSDIIRTTFDDGTITNSTADEVAITNSSFEQGTLDDVDGTDVRLVDSTIDNSAISNTSFDVGTITNSTANNVTITQSSFTDGDIFDSNANNVTITQSTFADGAIFDSTANNVTITQSLFTDGDITDSSANNVNITQSVFDDGALTNSTGDALDITNSDFSQGNLSDVDGDDVRLENSTFTSGAITDSTANNITMTFSDISQSVFTDGSITDSTANNIAITQSTFIDGDIFDSNANNIIITNSEFNDGTGNNNIFTNTIIDQSTITNSEISNTSFTGTMNGVVAQNMTITSSSASGFAQSQSTFDAGGITQSTFDGGVISNSDLVDFDMNLNKKFDPPLDEESYFAIKNVKTGETEQLSYKQLFDEVSKSTAQALKVHVDASSGDDTNPGTMLQPVQTLERAFELCLEKAGGSLNRNALNNAVHISVGPGTYYTKGNLALPDDCSITSTSGQYATVIEALPGYENNNGILVGSGCYVQGFGYMNWKVDNFDYPEGGFAVAYRPGAKLLRSPYLRDSTQLSNFVRADIEPPLNPYNSKGTLDDLGREFTLEAGHTGAFAVDDEITFSSGAKAYVSYVAELAGSDKIYVRNLKNNKGFAVGDTVIAESGGTGTIQAIGIDDFPNRLVGRGGGCVLADRRVLDPDSLYTYVLCFGFTPRTQNGLGYVARDGAGVNGIGSLSIFVRCAFYALNGGQMTLNNSGTQFGDISMRAKGTTEFFVPKSTSATIVGNTVFADTILENQDLIIDDMVTYLTANTVSGGLGYKGYDADKCERDSKIIIDGLGYDIALDSNYWGRLAGISYRSPISYIVPGEQLEETLGANVYLQGRVENIFIGKTDIIDRANTSMQELYNVLQYGEENINPITWVPTSVERTAARELLQDNRTFIQDELTDWIDNNDEFFSYDSVKCRRDTTEYILPAAKYDMLLATNYNAVTAGNAYYMAAASKVIGKQKEETIAAYRRLKYKTNDLISANTTIGASRVDAAFDEIISQLTNSGATFTPTAGTYDPATGVTVLTIGTHSLEVGDKILLAPESIVFACEGDGTVTRLAHPRPTDPAYNTPLEIEEVTATTITINVGQSAYVAPHTFVSALENAVSVLGSDIVFSDDAAISVDKRNARAQLQANKEFIQDLMLGYINNNYFIYDSEACRRDVADYILPAVQRDIVTGSNFNAIQSGIAYRQGTANSVILNELTQTVGAITELKQLVANNVITDNTAEHLSNESFKQLIDIIENNVELYTPTNATYDPITGIFVVTIGTHNLEVGDFIEIKPGSITFECGSPAEQISHPRFGDPAYKTPIKITAIDATTVTCNVGNAGGYTGTHTFVSAETDAINGDPILWTDPSSYLDYYTPTTATYDPVTGVSIVTIPNHDIAIGDYVEFLPYSFTFTCAQDGNATEHSYPRKGDGNYKVPMLVTAANSTTITVTVGAGAGGTHTFISATTDSVVKVIANSNGQFAREQLQANRNMIQEEVMAYLDTQYFVFDGAKCSRDTGLILDAVRRDVASGSNYHAVFAGLSYQLGSGSINVVVGDQLTETVGAINYLKSEIADELTGTTLTRANAAFDEIIDILNNGVVNADTVSFGTDTVSAAHTNAREALQLNKAFVKEEVSAYIVVNYPNLTYDIAKCERDTGFLLDAISWDIQHGSNAASVNFARMYYDNAIAVLPEDQIVPTVRTWEHIAEVAYQIVRAQAVTPSAGNTETQDQSEPDVGIVIGNAVRDLVLITTNVIENDTLDWLPAYDEPQIESGFETGVARIDGRTETLQDDVIEHIVNVFNGLPYNKAKCRRDVGLIIDAVCKDIEYGGNASTLEAAAYYFSRDDETSADYEQLRSVNVLPLEVLGQMRDTAETYPTANVSGLRTLINILPEIQRVPTRQAFERLADVAQQIVTEASITPSANTVPAQDTSGTAASVATGTSVHNLIQAIAELVDDKSSDYIPDAINPIVDPNRTAARKQIQKNKDFITQDVIEYLEDRNYTFDGEKCVRDMGYVLDAVSHDIQYGGNATTLNAAYMYFENAVNVLPAAERVATQEAFTHLAGLVEKIVQRQEVDFRPVDRFGVSTATYDPVSGETVITTFAPHTLSIGNYIVIQKEGLTFECGSPAVQISHPRVTDNAYRTPLRVTAVTSDTFTVNVGNAGGYTGAHTFVSATTNAILKVTNQYKQDLTHVAGNPMIASRAKALGLIIANVVDDGSYAVFPDRVDPLQTWQSSSVLGGKEAVEDEVVTLADNVLSYITNVQNGLSFPEQRCRRDIGYLVDAISHDVQYDGNYATRIATQIYFENGISVLPADTRQQTADIYNYLGTVFDAVIQEDTSIANTVYTDTPQDVSGTPGSPTEATRATVLVGYIEDAIRADTLAGLPGLEQPNTTWVTSDLTGAATQIDDNTDALANDLIEYINTEFNALDYNRAKCHRDVGYLVDAFSYDLNYGGNIASRWNADFYFWNNQYRVPENQRVATAKSYRQLGVICKDIVLGKYTGQIRRGELATQVESDKVESLANIFYLTQIYKDTKYLPVKQEPDYTYAGDEFVNAQFILEENKIDLAFDTIRYVSAEYGFINLPLTRRDAANLLQAISNDFRYEDGQEFNSPSYSGSVSVGSQNAIRTFVTAFFDWKGQHTFPVFNSAKRGLKYKGSVAVLADLASITGQKPNQAYIVATDYATSYYAGNIYYWDGSTWVFDGPNNTELLDAFTGSWDRMRSYIVNNLSPNSEHSLMVEGLFNDCLKDNILRPNVLIFGSLVESIAHQFNGASAGVNRNALPLNFRNLGSAISAIASVLSEDGGRIRWSGADELNNQYFARGLKINGRTGRIEGRPFTSSVRKLARRASNSRAAI